MEAIFAVGAASVATRVLAGRSALVSFAFMAKGSFLSPASVVKLCEVCPRVVLDSGAFSAWTKGKPIDLQAYIAHILEHGSRYAWIASLDAIGDEATSLFNWREIVQALASANRPDLAAKVVPVFHEGESIEILDLYASGSPLVGLGRTEGRRDEQKTFEFYDLAFNRHPQAKFHAFGNGDPKTLEVYPFQSFDCTTWERDASYGGKHRWPWSSCDKETRMRAYVEALSTVAFRKGRQLSLLDMMAASAAATVSLDGEAVKLPEPSAGRSTFARANMVVSWIAEHRVKYAADPRRESDCGGCEYFGLCAAHSLLAVNDAEGRARLRKKEPRAIEEDETTHGCKPGECVYNDGWLP